jgi:hypothetical protein
MLSEGTEAGAGRVQGRPEEVQQVTIGH